MDTDLRFDLRGCPFKFPGIVLIRHAGCLERALVVEGGADPLLVCYNGRSPLDIARSSRNQEVAEALEVRPVVVKQAMVVAYEVVEAAMPMSVHTPAGLPHLECRVAL